MLDLRRVRLLSELARRGTIAEVAVPDPPRRHLAVLTRRGAARRPAVAATLGALRRRAGT